MRKFMSPVIEKDGFVQSEKEMKPESYEAEQGNLPAGFEFCAVNLEDEA